MKARDVTLYAPPGYWTMPESDRSEIVGGCGPGWFGDMLVPDTLWGLNIRPACSIHDFMWWVAAALPLETERVRYKEHSDRVFLNNMMRLIRAAGGPRWLLWLRRRRAITYYNAVCYCGGPFFWDDNEANSEDRLGTIPMDKVEMAY